MRIRADPDPQHCLLIWIFGSPCFRGEARGLKESEARSSVLDLDKKEPAIIFSKLNWFIDHNDYVWEIINYLDVSGSVRFENWKVRSQFPARRTVTDSGNPKSQHSYPCALKIRYRTYAFKIKYIKLSTSMQFCAESEGKEIYNWHDNTFTHSWAQLT